MVLKQAAKINGYHSSTVGRKYYSSSLLESIRLDLSSDIITFSYWYVTCFFLLHLLKNWLFPESPLYGPLQTTPFHTDEALFLPAFARFCYLFVMSIQIFTCQEPISFPILALQDLCRFYIKSSTWHHIFDFFVTFLYLKNDVEVV